VRESVWSWSGELRRARDIIGREGFSGLFRVWKQGVSLPAAALVPVASALQGQDQGE
jgi:hypothetical protein